MNFYQTKTIKKYILCTLLFNPTVFFAMEKSEIQQVIPLNEKQTKKVIKHQANIIGDIIDEKYLGINPNSCFKEITGSVTSYYETSFLYPGEVTDKVNNIEICIAKNTATTNLTEDIKKNIIKELSDRHWYVHYLIKASIQQQIERLKNVTSFTIDQLLYPDFTHDTYGIKQMIHEKASELFINEIGLNNKIQDMPYQKSSDIHLTILYGHTACIDANSVKISKDGKYLKTADISKKIIWDTKNGCQTSSTIQGIKWSQQSTPRYKYHCIISENNDCAAICLNYKGYEPSKAIYSSNLGKMLRHIPANIRKNKQAIFLFMRPTLASYLCQQAFDKCLWQKFSNANTKSDNEQLIVFENSKSFKALEGFPQKNLTELIKKIKNDKDLIQ